MKYAIGFLSKYMDATILLEDGGVAEIHHNGMHIVSTYYQDRVESYDQKNLGRISEGKAYVKDWDDKYSIDDEVIQDALNWLCPMCDNFKKDLWGNIINNLDKNTQK